MKRRLIAAMLSAECTVIVGCLAYAISHGWAFSASALTAVLVVLSACLAGVIAFDEDED